MLHSYFIRPVCEETTWMYHALTGEVDFAQNRVRLRDFGAILLVLWKILMPLTSWLPRARAPMWLRSRLARIARVRSTRLIGLARLASVGAFRIAGLRPNSHREILQFFPNQTQFVDDLFSYLVFHLAPFTFYITKGDNFFSGLPRLLTQYISKTNVTFPCRPLRHCA